MLKEFPRFEGEAQVAYAREESRILGRDLWRNMKEFTFFLSRDTYVKIPRGYLVDGASVPRLLWSVIPPWGAYGDATVIHDFLCEYLSLMQQGKLTSISRERADNILAVTMEALEVPVSDQRLINEAVRAYRKVARITSPVWHRDKAELEARWVSLNPI